MEYQGGVRRLRTCQLHDPNRGSFMVNPVPVKKKNGNPKTIRVDGVDLHVMRGSNHVRNTRKGVVMEPHEQAIDYVHVPADYVS